MRREMQQIKAMKETENQTESNQANRELSKKVEQLTKELMNMQESQKALMLQRKNLIQGKEQVQKELEKVLRKTETETEKSTKLLKEKTLQFETHKMESD